MGVSFCLEIHLGSILGAYQSLELIRSLKCDTHFFITHKWIICCDPALLSSQHIPPVNSCVVGAEKGSQPSEKQKQEGVALGVVLNVTHGMSYDSTRQVKWYLFHYFMHLSDYLL